MTATNPRTLIVLVGASGVGKTTLQRQAATVTTVLRRVTTRPLQNAEETHEVIPVTAEHFAALRDRGQLAVSYKRYGHEYGVSVEEIERVPPGGIGLIALPAQYVPQLRSALASDDRTDGWAGDDWVVTVCWLKASPDTINRRLTARADPATQDALALRMKTTPVDHSAIAEIVLDAELSAEEISKKFAAWVSKLSGDWGGFAPEAIAEAQTARQYLANQTYQWAIFGGIAATWYAQGVHRDPTDIDILVDRPNLEQIAGDNPWLTCRRPTVLTADHVELRARQLTLHVGQHVYMWEFDEDARSRLSSLRLGPEVYPLLSAEDTIVMKCILQRGPERGKWDLIDVTYILANRGGTLDKEYLTSRATRCGALDRVKTCLADLGYPVPSGEQT
ncbi:MAG: hypothetical protein ACRCYU_08265 [Nocardioides sp.]